MTDTSSSPFLIMSDNVSFLESELQHRLEFDFLDWGSDGSSFVTKHFYEDSKPDVFLAADVLYDRDLFEDFISTLSFLLKKFPAACCLMTYQERSSSRSIEYLLDKWELKGERIPFENENGIFLFAFRTKHLTKHQ